MPANATIFDKKCKRLLELGSGPYNTVRRNPKGKLLCLAGFGNLPGDMAFWDVVDKKQLGTTRAECSVTSEWSADGRYFMTATTAPRLQVDNCCLTGVLQGEFAFVITLSYIHTTFDFSIFRFSQACHDNTEK
ncbi:hypothetical protein V6N11_065447 [Hibiscus sabdariffa]|uniref:Translation initiation factor beta propellor-like domain-containing protein n=1 Tax=Hibiscus sabdariffa TaxID=183260 RepID=A0ABR2PHU8_9ROSI